MKKKTLVKTGVWLFAIAAVAGLASIYWTQLRGIWPAITKPEEDIVRLLEESTSTPQEEVKQPEVNGKPIQQTQQGPLRLPKGFSISVFAKDLTDPRVLAFDPNGVLLASVTANGKVVALIDKNNDGKSEQTQTVIDGLNRPHGIVVECARENDCKLFVAENDKLAEFSYDPRTMAASGKRVIAPLPSGGGHFTRTLLPYGNSMLVSVGSSCNVCRENDPDRASILEIDIASGKTETFATGLRNSVFMAFHPPYKGDMGHRNGPRHAGRRPAAGRGEYPQKRGQLRLADLLREKCPRHRIRQECLFPKPVHGTVRDPESH